MADLSGRLIGEKRIVRAINMSQKIFIANLSVWLQDERGRHLGIKGHKKRFKSGYRRMLHNKIRKVRKGNWSKQVANQFKGRVSFARKINDLELKMGLFESGKRHQIREALELLSEGGSISSTEEMPIPMYRNLKKIGYDGPFVEGGVRSGLKSKAFRKFIEEDRLIRLTSGKKAYYFNKDAEKNSRGKYSRKDLLFMGVHGITVRKILTGRFDFVGNFESKKNKMIERGQRKVDKATKIVERKMSK